MKKLYLLLLVLLFISCREQHVFNTYYKQIDTDTLQAVPDKDGSVYYPLFGRYMDKGGADAMELDSLFEVVFYKPSTDEYFTMVFGNDGGQSARVYFNPFTGETDSIR